MNRDIRDMPIATHIHITTHIHIATHANAYMHTAGVSESNGECSMGSI